MEFLLWNISLKWPKIEKKMFTINQYLKNVKSFEYIIAIVSIFSKLFDKGLTPLQMQ